MRKNSLRNSSLGRFEEEGENPMEQVANLSDVMLVLAVGIMLALIAVWQVDFYQIASEETAATQESQSEQSTQAEEKMTEGEILELEQDAQDLDNNSGGESLEDYGLTEAGTLYQDADGNLYRVVE